MTPSDTSTQRHIDPREYCHESLGARFADALSDYDTARRVETLIDSFLDGHDLAGRSALDVGCGLGFFSERLARRGAEVTACDLGESLVRIAAVRANCTGIVADALRLRARFAADSFDLVCSSECIEHTPSPHTAIEQMVEVLRPGGLIVLSTPNLLWWPAVKGASLLRLRPFDGLENLSTFPGLRRALRDNGVAVIREEGLHLFPFQLPLRRLSRWCDRHLQILRHLMINICVLGRKRT